MGYCIAVFTSRHATLNFANMLRTRGVPAAIVNTPSSISKVCGISVKFPSEFRSIVSKLAGSAANFAGIYEFGTFRGRFERFEL